MLEVLAVAGMFFVRVGLPIILLVLLGLLVDRWQRNREEHIRQYYQPNTNNVIVGEGREAAEPVAKQRSA